MSITDWRNHIAILSARMDEHDTEHDTPPATDAGADTTTEEMDR